MSWGCWACWSIIDCICCCDIYPITRPDVSVCQWLAGQMVVEGKQTSHDPRRLCQKRGNSIALRTDPSYCQNGLEVNVGAACGHSISRVRRTEGWWWRSVCLWPLYSTYTDSVQIMKDTIKHRTNHVHTHKQINKMCLSSCPRDNQSQSTTYLIWFHVLTSCSERCAPGTSIYLLWPICRTLSFFHLNGMRMVHYLHCLSAWVSDRTPCPQDIYSFC